MHKEGLSLTQAMQLISGAESRLTSDTDAVHVAVQNETVSFALGEMSLLETTALAGMLAYFGWGTRLGTAPTEYIFRHGVSLDQRLRDLSLLSSHDLWMLRAEYTVPDEEFDHKAFLGVRAGKLVIAQITNGATTPISSDQFGMLCGIINGSEL